MSERRRGLGGSEPQGSGETVRTSHCSPLRQLGGAAIGEVGVACVAGFGRIFPAGPTWSLGRGGGLIDLSPKAG
jgi:hypothetical protein